MAKSKITDRKYISVEDLESPGYCKFDTHGFRTFRVYNCSNNTWRHSVTVHVNKIDWLEFTGEHLYVEGLIVCDDGEPVQCVRVSIGGVVFETYFNFYEFVWGEDEVRG